MAVVRGTVRNGVVVLDQPNELPEGERVFVESEAEAYRAGIPEEEWDTSPEGIAAWLKWYDTLEPLVMTAEDEERIAAAQAEEKAFELATRAEQTEKLRKLFD